MDNPLSPPRNDLGQRSTDPAAWEAMNRNSRERLAVTVTSDPEASSRVVAQQIAKLMRDRQAEGKACVLGLVGGSTPTDVYDELVRMHQEEGLSFAHVVTFNACEFYRIQPDELQSIVRFMDEHLFNHVDIDRDNIHIPDGTLDIAQVPHACAEYEEAIRAAGGIDLQLLGVGRAGLIGQNEPGSNRDSATRAIWLSPGTRIDAASDFFGLEHVPRRAITMGMGSILRARKIVLIAFGEGKAGTIAKAVEGDAVETLPVSLLQDHPDVEVYLDTAAAAELTRFKSPWRVGPVAWDNALTRKAVIGLSQHVDKPILKLTSEDYNAHGLQELTAAHGPSEEINLRVFRQLQKTISGWPGGKPCKNDSARCTDGTPADKRIVVFSPHPDDDVISMGGTLIRLADHGHQVHVAYQVSGNIAVFDEDAIRFADFAADFNHMFGIEPAQTAEIESHVEQTLKNKQPGQVDSERIRRIKGLIRRGECKAAARSCGIQEDRLHFLDMPFYETGTIRKQPVGDADVALIVDLLREVQPHQVYAAGDLSDPHGTHRVCLLAIFEAVRRCAGDAWLKDCIFWLYRGAWQEWGPDQIELAVPLSPSELDRKRIAIFKHESQKDKALFPGSDPREFWQRAEDRNRATADLYDALGLAEYQAIEGFVRWNPPQ